MNRVINVLSKDIELMGEYKSLAGEGGRNPTGTTVKIVPLSRIYGKLTQPFLVSTVLYRAMY